MQDIRPDVSWYLGLLNEGNFMVRQVGWSEGDGECVKVVEGGYLKQAYDISLSNRNGEGS